jgi:hypothetical protein
MRRRRPPRGRPWPPRARLLGDTPAPLLPPSPSLILSFARRENTARPRVLSHARHRCRLLHRHVLPPASFLRAIARASRFVISSSPPNAPPRSTSASGKPPLCVSRRATIFGHRARVPPLRCPCPLSTPTRCTLMFAIFLRVLCARSLVPAWSELAVGRRRAPHRRDVAGTGVVPVPRFPPLCFSLGRSVSGPRHRAGPLVSPRGLPGPFSVVGQWSSRTGLLGRKRKQISIFVFF